MALRIVQVNSSDVLMSEVIPFLSKHNGVCTVPNLTEFSKAVSDGSMVCLAVYSGTKLVGFGSIFYYMRSQGGLVGVIEDVLVDKDQRQKGIGSNLIKSLIKDAKSKKCFKVVLECTQKNIQFYQNLDFENRNFSMRLLLQDKVN